MKQVYHARKRRQLQHLAKKLKNLMKSEHHDIQSNARPLIKKMNVLIKELSQVLAPIHLKKILGPAALMLGLSFSQQATAQNFAAPVSNPFGLEIDGIFDVVDIDGDGDVDIFVGYYDYVSYNFKLDFIENIGTSTNPQFANQIANPFNINIGYGEVLPVFSDMDGDGDFDLFLTAYYEPVFRYYENTGTPTSPQFTAGIDNPFGFSQPSGEYTFLSSPADIDGDGDIDAFGFSGFYDVSVLYYENIGTAATPQFSTPQTDPFGLANAGLIFIPSFADLDMDGDMDLLQTSYYTGDFYYQENTGTATSPQFASAQENPFGLVMAGSYTGLSKFTDLDSDGDMDLLVVGDDFVLYYENIGGVGTQEQYADIRIDIHPNPVNDELNISMDIQFQSIEVYNAIGQLQCGYEGSVTSINTNEWAKGFYTLKFIDDKGIFTTKKVMKQ